MVTKKSLAPRGYYWDTESLVVRGNHGETERLVAGGNHSNTAHLRGRPYRTYQIPLASGQSRAIKAHVNRGEMGLSNRKWSYGRGRGS